MKIIIDSRMRNEEKEYLKMSNFVTDISKRRQVADVINKMKRQIKTNAKQHTATLHYLTNYGYIPMWILVKVLSFGLISELFMILKPEDQKEIAKYYLVKTIGEENGSYSEEEIVITYVYDLVPVTGIDMNSNSSYMFIGTFGLALVILFVRKKRYN